MISGWRGTWRIRTEAQRTSDEYGVWLMALLANAGLRKDDISAAVIGTVVPAALYNLRRLCRDWFSVEPLIARAPLNWGFDIRVDNPGEVGADRLANSLAGHTNFGGPLIVLDFGTATTFDVVDKDGGYLGGVICPGINLSLGALHQAAARLPRIGIGRPQSVIGRSTVPAMQSGIYWGYVGMIEGLVARIRAEYRWADEGDRHWGAGPVACGRDDGDRADRSRSHAGGAAAVGGTQPRAHIVS